MDNEAKGKECFVSTYFGEAFGEPEGKEAFEWLGLVISEHHKLMK